jgi:endonuclease/exonuclease/phosphatase family metal-dependent hydrolase
MTSRAAAGDAGRPRPLVVASVNLLHGGVFSGITRGAEDLDERLEMVADELRAVGVDVVGIQEASTGRRRGNVAARLAGLLGFDWAYTPALFQVTPWQGLNNAVAAAFNFTEGPAIVSRFPLVDREVRSLPRCRGMFEVRMALAADAETPWGRVPVISTHLSWGACETADLLEFVRSRSASLPGLLMGDFNAEETSPAMQRLTDAGLIDAFRTANPGEPGLTVWQRPSSPDPTVSRRVDFIFVIPGQEFAGRVQSSRVVLDRPQRTADGETLWPSDHYAVLAEIDVVSPLGQAGGAQ